MQHAFALGHPAIVHNNALPSLLAPTQPTLSVCGTDMHGTTALKRMLNDDVVKALLVDGRPLTVANTLGRVMRKHCPHGGHLKESHDLRKDTLVPLKEHHAAVAKLIHAEANDGIIVVADETTDEADEAMMAVSVITTTHLFMLGIEQVGPEEHNSIGYAACVQHIWGRYNLEGTKVRRFVTNNHSKWDKAWLAVDDDEGGGLCTLWPYAKRQRCFCHVLNVVMSALEEHSATKELAHAINVVQRLVSGVRNQQRRHRMKQHIGDIMPDPVATRHDSWI